MICHGRKYEMPLVSVFYYLYLATIRAGISLLYEITNAHICLHTPLSPPQPLSHNPFSLCHYLVLRRIAAPVPTANWAVGAGIRTSLPSPPQSERGRGPTFQFPWVYFPFQSHLLLPFTLFLLLLVGYFTSSGMQDGRFVETSCYEMFVCTRVNRLERGWSLELNGCVCLCLRDRGEGREKGV